MLSALPLLLACSSAPPAPAGPTVLLVTLDTTRADALGCYGGPGGTPVLDGLASEGVRFDLAVSHAPTTLSAHASLFTGLDPHGHTVPRNGFPLSPRHESMVERLYGLGYDTIGVIGSSALASDMGLSRGFRVYDEELSADLGRRFEDSAEQVTARALAAVDERDTSRPLFLWVHYFDAHSPYAAPEALQRRYVDPDYRPQYPMGGGLARAYAEGRVPAGDREHLRGLYQAEVAYVDGQLGTLLEGLEARGLLADALVVVVGDHGEMFFEDRRRPVGHGADIDLPVTRIPLIVSGRGGLATRPRVVPDPVALSELGGTLLGLLGDGDGLGTGRDLRPLLRGEALAPAPIYLEATQPAAQERPPRWNNALSERGLIWKGHILTVAPFFREPPRLAPIQRAAGGDEAGSEALERELYDLLKAWDRETLPPYRGDVIQGVTLEGLRALGYIEE